MTGFYMVGANWLTGFYMVQNLSELATIPPESIKNHRCSNDLKGNSVN